MTRFAQGYIKTTDADRASMGITIRSSKGGTGVPPVPWSEIAAATVAA